jgi:hypothetical protein
MWYQKIITCVVSHWYQGKYVIKSYITYSKVLSLLQNCFKKVIQHAQTNLHQHGFVFNVFVNIRNIHLKTIITDNVGTFTEIKIVIDWFNIEAVLYLNIVFPYQVMPLLRIWKDNRPRYPLFWHPPPKKKIMTLMYGKSGDLAANDWNTKLSCVILPLSETLDPPLHMVVD